MTIHYEGHRQGMTILPPEVDQATGEVIEGTEQIVDTRHVAFAKNDVPTEADPHLQDLIEENSEEDLDDPDYLPLEVRLSDTCDEIHTSPFEPSPDVATQILHHDNGNTAPELLVQNLAYKAYNGEITPAEAFEAAVNSGHNPDLLMKAYYQLKSKFE